MTITVKVNLHASWSFLFYSSNFEQIISLPTRCENILDLCITNIQEYILDSGVYVPPDPDLDHLLIWVNFSIGAHQNPKPMKYVTVLERLDNINNIL